MVHRVEIDTIIAQVAPWPMEERIALAHRILGDMPMRPRPPAPRRTLERALGIAGGASAPPDDATVRRWVEERRLQKHG
jgi:hypothetical protein